MLLRILINCFPVARWAFSPGTQVRGETMTWTFGRPIVSIRDVQKASSNQELSKGVFLGVMKGEVICITNRSGSGQSTLIRGATASTTPGPFRSLSQGKSTFAVDVIHWSTHGFREHGQTAISWKLAKTGLARLLPNAKQPLRPLQVCHLW